MVKGVNHTTTWFSLPHLNRGADPDDLNLCRSFQVRSLEDLQTLDPGSTLELDAGRRLAVVENQFQGLRSEINSIKDLSGCDDLPSLFDKLLNHINFQLLPVNGEYRNENDTVEVMPYGIISESIFEDTEMNNSDLIKILGLIGQHKGVDAFLVPDFTKKYTGPNDEKRLSFFGGYKCIRFFDGFSKHQIKEYETEPDINSVLFRTIGDMSNLQAYLNGDSTPRFYARFPAAIGFGEELSASASTAIETISKSAGLDSRGRSRLRSLELEERDRSNAYIPPRDVSDLFDRYLDEEVPLHTEEAIRNASWAWRPKQLILLDSHGQDPGQLLRDTRAKLMTDKISVVAFDPARHPDSMLSADPPASAKGPRLRVATVSS